MVPRDVGRMWLKILQFGMSKDVIWLFARYTAHTPAIACGIQCSSAEWNDATPPLLKHMLPR